jgi:basic membrane protein A
VVTGVKQWRRVAAVVAVAAVGGVAAGCGSDAGSEPAAASTEHGKKIKMAALYLPNLEADAWSRAFNDGTQAAIDKVGSDRVTLKNVEGVPYSTQATQITEQLLQQGNDIVLDTLAAGDLFYAGCAKFPDKVCDSVQALGNPPPNVTGHWFKFWESFYLYGVAGGLLTKSDHLGYVATFEQPFEMAHANALLLGCRSVNPKCQVDIVYINSFNDAPKAVEAAQALVNGGADVLSTFVVTPGPLEIAQKNGVWAFSQYSDQTEFGPDALVSGVLMKGAVEKEMELVLNSLLKGEKIPQGPRLYGLANGLEMAPWGAKVPEDVRSKVDAVKQEIVEGKNVFTGPLRDQTGKVRVQEGEELTDEFLFEHWNWYVDGVSAK